MGIVYRYTLRNAEENDKPLIEFIDLPKDKEFVKQLIRAFKEINVQVVNYEDLWMNDEIVLNADSDIGTFTFYRDAEDRYYITGPTNGNVILLIDTILKKNLLFERI